MDDTLAREMIRLLEQLVEQTKPKVRASTVLKPKTGPETDDQWLERLSRDPTYAGMDVKREFGKAKNWYGERGKQVTRRSFIGWLNRAERPVVAAVARPVQGPPVMHRVTPRLPEGEGPPPEVAKALSRLLGKDMSFIGGKR